MKVAVICAMDEEIALLRSHMQNISARREAGLIMTDGTLASNEIVLCLSGVGKTNAAATAQYAISAEHVDAIINIGLAGNCTDLPLGGAVVPDSLVYHDLKMEWVSENPPYLDRFIPDDKLAAAALKACEKVGVPIARGTLATGEQFVCDNDVKSDIMRRTGAACIDMEGTAIAHIAQKNEVPFVTVKVMSDNASDGALGSFHETLALEQYCERSAAIVCELVTLI
ncbi:MAG: 5'-methylthioadenosine/S-adenosylhomocysteine nucleosidase [Oscillospiraceae bacterium]